MIVGGRTWVILLSVLARLLKKLVWVTVVISVLMIMVLLVTVMMVGVRCSMVTCRMGAFLCSRCSSVAWVCGALSVVSVRMLC